MLLYMSFCQFLLFIWTFSNPRRYAFFFSLLYFKAFFKHWYSFIFLFETGVTRGNPKGFKDNQLLFFQISIFKPSLGSSACYTHFFIFFSMKWIIKITKTVFFLIFSLVLIWFWFWFVNEKTIWNAFYL